MQRIAAQLYPSSLLIPSPPLFNFFYSHVLVVSACPAEIWTSTAWLAVLVKAELRFWEAPWHSTIIVTLFSLRQDLPRCFCICITSTVLSDIKCQCFKDCLIISVSVFGWADRSRLSIRLLSTLISRKCNKSVGNALVDVPEPKTKAENRYVSEAGAIVPSHDCLTVVMEKI